LYQLQCLQELLFRTKEAAGAELGLAQMDLPKLLREVHKFEKKPHSAKNQIQTNKGLFI
jgi:hypothetical protein